MNPGEPVCFRADNYLYKVEGVEDSGVYLDSFMCIRTEKPDHLPQCGLTHYDSPFREKYNWAWAQLSMRQCPPHTVFSKLLKGVNYVSRPIQDDACRSLQLPHS